MADLKEGRAEMLDESILKLVLAIVQDVQKREMISDHRLRELLGLQETRQHDSYLFIAGDVQEQEILLGKGVKWYARFASHKVLGCDDQVGPNLKYIMRFRIGERAYENRLTRRQLVFGVGRGQDGFKGLCDWQIEEVDTISARVDLIRANEVNATEWIIPFVREIILAAGWKVEFEELCIPSAKAMKLKLF